MNANREALRILRVADVADNRAGGMTRMMHFGADALRRDGHDVSLLLREQIALDCPFVLRRFLVPWRVLRRIYQRREQFDVVEIHEPLAAPYAAARRRDRSLPPLVVLSHGLEERALTASISYHQKKRLAFALHRRLFPLSTIWQARYAVRHADHVLCCNQDDIDFLVSEGVPKERLSRNINGVSDSFLEQARPRGEGRDGWLFVGSWIVRKGTLDLVPAMTRVLRRHTNSRFTAIGTGCDADVVTGAFPADVRDRVRAVRRVDDDALAAECRAHVVFVLPSMFEGQPLSMFEAAAAEMAIVTTKICGMKDFIRDGENGRLVPVGDPEALERALETATAEAPVLGPRARADAMAGHTWRHAANRLVDAYRKAVFETAVPSTARPSASQGGNGNG